MLPDRVLNPGPLTYESGALRIALRGPAESECGNHIFPDNFMITEIFTTSFCPLTDCKICRKTDNLSFDR